MAGVSHREDLAGHPDITEMRDRYAQVLGGRDVALVDGPVFLVGLACAISPWVVHFSANQPALATHNLIMGIAIAVLALGFTVTPQRMYGLSGAMCAMGVWLVIAPWIVGSSPDAGVIWTNVILGALTFVLGLVCMAATMRSGRASRSPA
ncbi:MULTISPECIES: SPW repeat protein [unclassified Streptomyces]|uniref:SPW repeat protein n=1 Tax=unclassified Streptomyces TaxID=2593676 RepID=UPI002E27B0F0|nr:SPW repeat protein [Streptomyces sp. NBC_00690]